MLVENTHTEEVSFSIIELVHQKNLSVKRQKKGRFNKKDIHSKLFTA